MHSTHSGSAVAPASGARAWRSGVAGGLIFLSGVALFILMAGVFTRPELVLEPGLAQVGAMLLLIVATVGVTFSLQAQFARRRAVDLALRIALAALALVVLLHPSRELATVACVPVALFVAYWIVRCRTAPVVVQPAAS